MEDLNNTFKEVTSREGLVQDKAFYELKNAFYLTAHKRLEKYVVEGLKWDSVPADVLKELNKRDNSVSFNDTMFQISDEQKNAYALEALRRK